MDGPVSGRLWIYFVTAIPLTAAVVGSWFLFDRLSKTGLDEDSEEVRERMYQLEKRITERIRDKTGARVKTWEALPA